jgi:hypothetical protein
MRRRKLKEASRLRGELQEAWQHMGTLLGRLGGRRVLVRGTLYERRRRCGRQGCRCERGELHVAEAFSVSEAGKTKHLPLGGVNRQRLREGVENYRRFRAARRQLRAACRRLLALADQMEELRRVSLEEL